MARHPAAGKGKPRLKKSSGGPTAPPGRLRIVAGKWRSRRLEIADVPGLRPTSERIRETLFNWLAYDIAGLRCLDLFAGTGALGLEALSRGAAHAVFVENSRRAQAALRRNIATLDAVDSRVHDTDAADFLERHAGEPFDIVFLDPPFGGDDPADLCRLLADTRAVASGSRIYIEQPRANSAPVLPDSWQWVRQGAAGNVRYGLAEVLAPAK